MRKTIALLGAATLAIAGLVGPTSASELTPQTDIEFATTGAHMKGVQPDTVTDVEAWFELENTALVTESLDGVTVVGCVGSSNTRIEFVTYGQGDVIAGEDIARTADPNFSGSADYQWFSAASGMLNSNDYHLRLAENFGSPSEVAFAEASNGTPDIDCVNSLPPMSL